MPQISSSPINWKTLLFTALRIALGLLWLVIAIQVWKDSFASHLAIYHQVVFRSQPGVLMPWFGIWALILSTSWVFFLYLIRIAAIFMALSLLIGFARKTAYITGIIASFLCWALLEGFSPQHTFGSFGLSAALIYAFILAFLIAAEKLEGPLPYNIDAFIIERWAWWKRISEFAVKSTFIEEESHVNSALPAHRLLTVLSAVILAFFISGISNALNLAHPESPDPLIISGTNKVERAMDATLPPLLGAGDDVSIHIEATPQKVEISSGVFYKAWTFDGSVPAPTIHVRQGQTVHVTLTNKDSVMPHSLDFHSAMIAPDRAFVSASFGETVEFSFKAEVPGTFLYHCGTAPVILHQANGMFGAIIVDPIEPLPEADVSYVLVQSEWYTQHITGTTMMGDYNKIIKNKPDLVVFNGVAFQYRDHPLPAKVGQRVRIYFVDAGPNRWSSFHVIGGIFDKIYLDKNSKNFLEGVSAYSVGPGQGNIFDIVFNEPGNYTFVDHNMSNMTLGAMGIFEVK